MNWFINASEPGCACTGNTYKHVRTNLAENRSMWDARRWPWGGSPWLSAVMGQVTNRGSCPDSSKQICSHGQSLFFSDPVITWSHRCVATRGGSDGTKGHLLHLLHYPYHAGCHPYHAGPPGTRRRIHGPALGPLLPLTHPLSSDGDGTACSVVPNHQRTDFVRGWHLATRAPWGATNHLTRTSTGHLTSTHMNSVVNVTTTDGTAHGAIHGGVHLWHNPWRHCGAPMVRKVAQVCHPPPPKKKTALWRSGAPVT